MLEAFATSRTPPAPTDLTVCLTFAERQKSRHKTQTACGQTLGWFIERGQVLSDGDFLVCQNGVAVRVVAAPELVSRVVSNEPFLLMRAAYHLGNRHVPLQLNPDSLIYAQDHVLDAMLVGLGLEVTRCELPFQPENGAYHGKAVIQIAQGHGVVHSHGSHHHSHSHSHSHSHE